MKSVTLKVGGPHEVILGDYPLFMEQATCPLIEKVIYIYIYIFFSFKSVWSSCAQPPPYPKGKKPTQTRHHIILALKFGSHIWAAHGTASQNVTPN